MSLAQPSGQEFGLLGAVVIPIVTTFVWYVRAMRADLKEDRAAFRTDINQAHGEFTDYLKESAERQTQAAVRQTEALVSVGNALQSAMAASEAHERRALRRHEQVMAQLEGRGERSKDLDFDVVPPL